MTVLLYREMEKLFYLVLISLPKRDIKGKICLEHTLSVSLMAADLRS